MLFLRGLFLTSFLISMCACGAKTVSAEYEKDGTEEKSYKIQAKDGAIKITESHPKQASELQTPKAAK